MSEKLVHHLFGQHSLRYVPRSEVDMSPAQIFTYGGQHPPVSRILVLSLNAHSCLKEICKAYGQVPQQQTPSKRMETSKHPNLWTSSAISRHVHLAAKKKGDTVVFAVSSCRSFFEDVQTAGLCRYWRRKQQHVESGEHPTANKQVKMRSMRRQCSLHSQMLGTNYQSCEQLGWRVQDKWKNDLTKKKNTQEKNFTNDTKVGQTWRAEHRDGQRQTQT